MFVTTNAGYIRLLADALTATRVGNVLTYADCDRAVGFAILKRRYLVLDAMRLANDESGAIFKNVTKVGYQRLSADETPTLYMTFRSRTRRFGTRTARMASNAMAKSNEMSDKARKETFAEERLCGIITALTHQRNLPVIKSSDSPPPLASTVAESVKMMREHLTSIYG